MNIDLSGQVAIVTGAGRGIGKEIASVFAGCGATVVLAARSADQLAEAASEIAAQGGTVVTTVTDVSDPDTVRTMMNVALEQTGRIDVLINNAGISYVATVVMSDDARWREVVEINLLGVYLCTKAVLRHMVPAKVGRIVNISSVAGLVGASHNSAYAASKAGVVGFTKSVALEVAKIGITVNAICPWHLDTELLRYTMGARGKMFGKTGEDYLTEIAASSPQGRLITSEEVAGLALFLVSPEARGITGQAINVSGGAVM